MLTRDMLMKKNRYPVYIVSKGRYKNMLTDRALKRLGIEFKVVVEEEEYEEYAKRCGKNNILVLPKKYLDDYDTCDSLGNSKSKGPGAARNFCWEHSIKEGFAKHWVLDDNLDDFHRLNRNLKVPVRTNATFRASEDFVDRYNNVAIAGMNYYSFCKTTDAVKPFQKNTRVYSCLLIRNDIPFRWRGRYNEDTDICLRVLKAGWATIQFNAFLCGKVTTQRMQGGNTAEFYKEEGTRAKSQMIEDLHPDVAKVVWRFNRWHHLVDYKPFKNNDLGLKDGIIIKNGIDNYGMILTDGDKNDKKPNWNGSYYGV